MAQPVSLLKQLEDLESQMEDVHITLVTQQQERMKAYREESRPLTAHRDDIISGKAKPTTEELEGFKPVGNGKTHPAPASDIKDQSAAIPFFWLSAMLNTPNLGEHITPQDKRALEFLERVSVVFDSTGLCAEFNFRENPYFYNQVLRRGLFVLDAGSSEDDLLTTEQSTQIEWKDGMALTMKEVTRRRGGGRKGKNAGAGELVQTLRPCPSFFQFFGPIGRPPKADFDPTMEDQEEVDEGELEEQQQRKQMLDGAILTAVVNVLVPTAGTRYLQSPIYSLPPARDTEDEEVPEEEDDYEIITTSPSSLDSLPVPVQQAIHTMAKVQSTMDRSLERFKAEEREGIWHAHLKMRDLCEQRRALLVVGGKNPATGADDANPETEAQEEEHLAISKFWLLAMLDVPQVSEVIQKRDERILSYLADVRFVRPKPPTFDADAPSSMATGTLELEFLPNPFIKQRVLKKTYYLEDSEVKLTKAEEVAWNEGCDPTVRVGRDGKFRPHRSFFSLFKPRGEMQLFGLEGNNKEVQAQARELEGELLQAIRQELIPSAGERYTLTVEQYGPDGGLADSNEEDDDDDGESEEEEEDGTDGKEDTEERRAARMARAAAKKKRGAEEGFKMSRAMWLMLLLAVFIVADVFFFFDTIMGTKPDRW